MQQLEEESIHRVPVRLLTTVQQSEMLAQRILDSSHHSIGLDCSGEKIGRFGKLALLQVATEDDVSLVDVEIGGLEILEPFRPVFTSTSLVKVFHDCREAVSFLLNQLHIPTYSVYDIQVAFTTWLEREGLEEYQASLAEIIRSCSLSTYRLHRWDRLERNTLTPSQWHQRPLQPQVIRQAVEGVVHLTRLQATLNKELGDPSGTLVQRRSAHYTDYARMNCRELPLESSLRSGMKLEAMLVSKKPDAAYFKLNHTVTGAVLVHEDLKEFIDLKPGAVAECHVKSVSPCHSFAYLQREGHGNLWFDQRQGRFLVCTQRVLLMLSSNLFCHVPVSVLF